jgi:hypothetical protein
VRYEIEEERAIKLEKKPSCFIGQNAEYTSILNTGKISGNERGKP